MHDVNSMVERLFQPSAVLPSQYFDSRPAELSPEKRLMFAVLIDAVRCLEMGLTGPASRKRTLAEVEWWLFRARGDQLFSFDSVCEALEIDPDHLRRGLLRWRDQKLAGKTSRMTRRSPVALFPRLGAPAPHLRRARRSAGVDETPLNSYRRRLTVSAKTMQTAKRRLLLSPRRALSSRERAR